MSKSYSSNSWDRDYYWLFEGLSQSRIRISNDANASWDSGCRLKKGKELGKELEKEQRTLCKGFTYKNFTYTPVHWDKCQTKSRKSMIVANHAIVDWGPHGMWLSDCSDDINNTVCHIEGHWYYDGTLLWQRTWVAWRWINPTSS